MSAPQLRAARAPRVTCDMTLPCVASPRFASRHGTSRSGMSGMSRPATVPNAAPVFGRSRSSGFSSGRLHSRCLRTSQMCRCVHPRGRAFAVSVWCAVRLEAGYRTELPAYPTLPFPFCGRCVGGGVGAPGAAASLPRTSVPVRWAVRGEVGPRGEMAGCPRCCLCRSHARHLGALQKSELREPQDWAKAPGTVRL